MNYKLMIAIAGSTLLFTHCKKQNESNTQPKVQAAWSTSAQYGS